MADTKGPSGARGQPVLHPKRRLEPPALEAPSPAIADFNDTYHYAYSAARLREACQLFARTIASGATPSEAVSWGKVDPNMLPDAVVCYTDTTIAMPLLTHYALAKHKPRKLKRLYDQRAKVMKALTKEYFTHNPVKMVDGSEPKF